MNDRDKNQKQVFRRRVITAATEPNSGVMCIEGLSFYLYQKEGNSFNGEYYHNHYQNLTNGNHDVEKVLESDDGEEENWTPVFNSLEEQDNKETTSRTEESEEIIDPNIEDILTNEQLQYIKESRTMTLEGFEMDVREVLDYDNLTAFKKVMLDELIRRLHEN